MDCPSESELSSFAMGDMSNEKISCVASHCEQCPDCQESLETLAVSSDTVLESIRRGMPNMPFIAEEPCLSLLERTTLEAESAVGSEAKVLSKDDQLGQYQVIELLGQGGMGAVYKARHTKLKRTVALKLLLSPSRMCNDNVARFEREMASVGQLSHPNIVVAHDAGEVGGHHYLAMELLDGIDLSRLLRANGPLPVASACELIRQAAIGLHHAHENGLIHRDVKPSNLMLTNDGTVKVLDLGLARTRAGVTGNDDAELTTTGQVMGTITYMAPEQCHDPDAVDTAADVYGLGASLYKLLTGVAPYSGEQLKTPMQQLAALVTMNPPSIGTRRDDLPKKLVELVDSMTRRQPNERPATMADVEKRLEPFADANALATLLPRTTSQGAAVESRMTMPTARSNGSTNRRHVWFKRLAIAALAAATLFAFSQIRVSTKSGDIVIITEGGVPVTITQDTFEFKDPDDGRLVRVTVDHDQKKLTLRKGGFETLTKEFDLGSDNGDRIKVKFVPNGEKTPRVKRTPTKPATPMPKSTALATKQAITMIEQLKAAGGEAKPTREGLNLHFSRGHTANARQLAQMGSDAGVNIALLGVASSTDLREFVDYGRESGAGITTVKLSGREHDEKSLSLVEQISPPSLVLANTGFKTAALTRLLQRKQWQSLAFHNQTLSPETMQVLRHQTQLKDLMFTSISGLESWDMRELEGLPLTSLQLFHTKLSNRAFESIRKPSTITVLKIAGVARSETEADQIIASIGELRNLKDLLFYSRYTKGSDIKPLAGKLKALTSLYCWMKPDSLEGFETFTKVTNLSLDFSGHDDRLEAELKPLEKLTGLDVLKLSHATPEQLAHLRESLTKCTVSVTPKYGQGLRD